MGIEPTTSGYEPNDLPINLPHHFNHPQQTNYLITKTLRMGIEPITFKLTAWHSTN